jgi:hypothetical protein
MTDAALHAVIVAATFYSAARSALLSVGALADREVFAAAWDSARSKK